jgi:hypothetical protein
MLERELVQLGRDPGIEHAQQARGGERRKGRLVVVAVGARHPCDRLEVLGRLARVTLGERDRRQRRMRRREPRPASEPLARELEAVEEPARPRGREREDALEHDRLIRTARHQQRAVAAHRFLDVAVAQLLIDRVHQVVRRGELEDLRPHAELATARARRPVRDLDRRARDPDVDQLDLRYRRQPPPARWQDMPEQCTDQIDLDVAQPAHLRAVGDARLACAEQRRQQPVGDHRARRRQLTVHADRAGQRAQLRARRHQLDVKRQLRGREAIRRARAHRDVAVVQPRGELGHSEPCELLAQLSDPLVDRRLRDPHGEAAQPGAPALESLCYGDPGIRSELAHFELELVDRDEPDRQLGQHEASDTSMRLEMKRQAPRCGGSSLEHSVYVNRKLRPDGRATGRGSRSTCTGDRSSAPDGPCRRSRAAGRAPA